MKKKFFFTCLIVTIICFFDLNISSFISTAICDNSKDDDVTITTPSFTVPSITWPIPSGAVTAAKDMLFLKGFFTILKTIPATPTTRMAFTVAGFGTYKFGLGFAKAIKNHQSLKKSDCASSSNNSGVANSPLEHPSYNFVSENTNVSPFDIENYLPGSYDDLQTAIICCVGLLFLVVFIFTFLIFSILSKHYIHKIKPFIEKYPKLNAVYLFYSKWNEKVLIPVRIFFVSFIYGNLILCISFLIIICKVFFNS